MVDNTEGNSYNLKKVLIQHGIIIVQWAAQAVFQGKS